MKKIITLLFVMLSISVLPSCSSDVDTHTNASKTKLTVPPISVQLWSVRDKLKNDFKGTLKTLSDLGFQGVEFAGDYGSYSDDAEGLKTLLTSLGLKASGAHLGTDQLKGSAIAKQLTFFKTLGIKYVMIPADSRAWTASGVEDIVKDINALDKKLATFGLQLGYHNHDKEFDAYQNSTYWDYIAQNTSKNVVLQMDVGWVNFAGKDPIDYLTRYRDRTLTTHIKVRTHEGSGQSPILGQDGYDWAKHIKHTTRVGGTQWLVLEQEEYPDGDSMQAVAQSKKGLDAIISKL